MHRSYYDKTVRRIRDLSCGDVRIYLDVEVRRVQCKRCGKVKREKLSWQAGNPFYTKRFSSYVGRKCRAMTVRDVARELKLDWHAVKALDKEYMEKQLRRGKRRKAQGGEATPIEECTEISGSTAKRAWARLIKQVYEADPLVCPRCAGSMRLIAFIEQPAVIEKILRHLVLWPAPAHSPPVHSSAA